MNTIEEYKAYSDKIGNRKRIYQSLQRAFDIKSALYPGSHIDIAPSLFIPHVTYGDATLAHFDDDYEFVGVQKTKDQL